MDMLQMFMGTKPPQEIVEEDSENEAELKRYIKAFRMLDNNVNQFFENYQNMPRTSYNMGEIWKAVMHARIQMVNAIGHMQDEERYLDSPYKERRIEEMTKFITPLRQTISRAVGILTLFMKNLTGPDRYEWFYERATFLRGLATGVADMIYEQTDGWRHFLLDLYEIQNVTREAYLKHIEEADKNARTTLEELEAIRAENLYPKLRRRYEKKFKSEGTRVKFRFLATLEDIQELIKETSVGGDYDLFMKEIREECGVRENFKRRSSFTAIKPYQIGLTDLGPFGVLPLKNPKSYFRAETTPGKHPDGSNYFGYLELIDKATKDEFHNVFRFNWYKCNTSELTPLKVSKHAYAALSIPAGATQFAWVFPNIDDTKVALAPPEQLVAINAYKRRENAITCIMATGGFAYFDKDANFLGINGLYVFGDDMFFDGPYAFPSKEKQMEYVTKEKMQEVTVPFLRDIFGCDRFGWISEDPDLGIETGAFYYEYAAGQGKEPNYFKFLDFEQAKLKKLKNNNTPGIQYLTTLYERFKDTWGQEDKIKDLSRALSMGSFRRGRKGLFA